MASSLAPYGDTIAAASSEYGVPQDLLTAQLMQESGGQANPSGGVPGGGIAQFIPSTAASLNVNPLDPTSSINGAAKYDAQLYNSTGSWTGAVEAYGTLPSNAEASSTLVPGQQAVLAAAQSADNGETYGGSGFVNPATAPNIVGTGSLVGNVAQAAGVPSVASITSSLQGYFVRISAVVVGVILIGVGLTYFKPISAAVTGTIRKGMEIAK